MSNDLGYTVSYSSQMIPDQPIMEVIRGWPGSMTIKQAIVIAATLYALRLLYQYKQEVGQWLKVAAGWLHGAAMVLALVTAFTLCGGWSLVGYYFVFEFIPTGTMDSERIARK